MDGNMLTLVIAALAFLAIAGIGMALSGGDNDAARKRARAIGAGTTVAVKGRAGKAMDESAKRQASDKLTEMLQTATEQNDTEQVAKIQAKLEKVNSHVAA